MRKALPLLAALTVFILSLSVRQARAQVPNGPLDSDSVFAFSLEQNPVGSWAYGYKPAGGSFVPYGSNTNLYGTSLDTWSKGSCCLMVTRNATGTAVTYAGGQVTQPADMLNLHPGQSGERSVMRWTAASSGTYTITGRFQGIDTVGTTTDVAVTHSGALLTSGQVNGYGAQVSFLLTRIVAAGDIVEFSVGVGSNGNYFNDSTGLAVAIAFEGKASHSLALNGTGAYVEVPSSESLNITGPLTVEAWIKINSSGRLMGIVERYNWLNTPDGGFALRLTADNKIQFHTVRSNIEAAGVQGGTSLAVGTWHHVAGVFDGRQIKVYVNGKLDGAVTSTVAPAAGTTSLKIGVPGHWYPGDTNNYFFDGLIDEVRVTAGAAYEDNFSPQLPLTPNAIVRNGDGAASVRGYWDFEGQTAADSSGYDNRGSLISGAVFAAQASNRQPQIIIQEPYTINFNGFVAGTLVTNQYHPQATFSSLGFSAGMGAFSWQPKPFVANTNSGFRSLYSHPGLSTNADLYIHFPTAVNNLTFRILNAHAGLPFLICYIDVFQNHNYFGTYSASANGTGNPISVNGLSHIPNVTGIRIYNVMNGMDWTWQRPDLIYYDDFNFTYPLNCPSSTNACPTPTPVPTPAATPTPTPSPTPEIKQVVLLSSTGDAEHLTLNPNIVTDGGPGCAGRCGLRVFPDKRAPEDAVNRRRVQVRALTSYPSGTPVFFRSFDVDDPSANSSPVDPTGSSGDDNKTDGTSKSGMLSSPVALTDVSGVATVSFDTTMQPGDNFRIAASTDRNYLNSLAADGLDIRESGSNGIPSGPALPTKKADASVLLTVWRRVHIEADSMGVVSDNQVVGTIASSTYDATRNATTLTIRQEADKGEPTLLKPVLEQNRFQQGRIQITDGMGFTDYANVISNESKTIEVSGQLSANPVGLNFTLWDDDDYNGDNGLFRAGDNGEEVDPYSSSLSLVRASDSPSENVFAHAYIQPSFGWAGSFSQYTQNNVPFKPNIPQVDTAIESQIESYRNTGPKESDDFWIVYIQFAYQGDAGRDNDPTLENEVGGITLAPDAWVTNDVTSSTEVPRGGYGSLIYLEIMRDAEAFPQLLPRKRKSVPHEIGHQFGLRGETANGFGIMSFAAAEPDVFVARHINVMRWRVKSPGQL